MRVTVILMAAGLALILAGPMVGCKNTESNQSAEPAVQSSPNAHAQTTCPVMGEKIDQRHYTDYQGKRIYFCCASCIETFKQEPGKYLKALEDQGVILEDAPSK